MLRIVDKISPAEVLAIYENVYVDCFPDQNVICSFRDFAKFHKAKILNTIIAYVDDEVCAGLSYLLLPENNAIYITYLGVVLEHRHEGIATVLMKHICSMFPEYTNMVAEVDMPHLKFAQKDFHFWDKHNFCALNIEYTQPALKDCVDVHSMWLCIKPSVGCVEKETVLALLTELYTVVYFLHGRQLQTYMKEYKKLPKVVSTIPIMDMVEQQGGSFSYGK